MKKRMETFESGRPFLDVSSTVQAMVRIGEKGVCICPFHNRDCPFVSPATTLDTSRIANETRHNDVCPRIRNHKECTAHIFIAFVELASGVKGREIWGLESELGTLLLFVLPLQQTPFRESGPSSRKKNPVDTPV